MRQFAGAVLLCGSLVVGSVLAAGIDPTDPPEVMLVVTMSDDPNLMQTLSSNSQGSISFNDLSGNFVWQINPSGDLPVGGLLLGQGATINVDPDPFLSLNAAFTNPGSTDGDFTITAVSFSSETISQPDARITGSTAVSIGDNDGDGATLSSHSNGQEIYNAFIGNPLIVANDVRGLLPPPYSLTAPANLTNVDSDGYVFENSTSGITTGDTFGIRHDFNLSGDDQATFNSTFLIEVVPEPGTAVLLGVGGVLLAARRRA